MSERTQDELLDAWRRMSRQNGWSLVQNEKQFLEQALAEYGRLKEDKSPSMRAHVAVKCAYSALIYQGLLDHNDTAAQELYQAMFRRSLGHGWSEETAKDLAQETVTRIWLKLSSIGSPIRSPQGLLSVAFLTLRTVERSYRTHEGHEIPFATQFEGEQEETVDPIEMAVDVEQRILSETIRSQLRAALPNDLQRQVLIRNVIFGEPPRELARELGLPLYRTRAAKSLAIQRLRADPDFGNLLDNLVESP